MMINEATEVLGRLLKEMGNETIRSLTISHRRVRWEMADGQRFEAAVKELPRLKEVGEE